MRKSSNIIEGIGGLPIAILIVSTMFYPYVLDVYQQWLGPNRLVKAKRESKTGVEAENSVESKQQESWLTNQ